MPIYSVRKSLIPLAKKIVIKLCREGDLDEKKLKLIRNRITRENGGVLPKNLELIQAYRELLDDGKITDAPNVLKVIQKRKVRTLSGIANITVLMKDMGCPGQCIYCPTEKGMPKSYLSTEPAMMRAVRNEFDAYKQVKTRLNGLVAQGHDVSKIDIRIAGGTWGAYPDYYRAEFVSGIYLALNEGPDYLNSKFESRNSKEIRNSKLKNSKIISDFGFRISNLSLKDLIKTNETARCRCVGLWVETRPDWVNEKELRRMREYGVTGIELGVQSTDDKVNEFCKRGHGLKESIEATKMCRNIGLKICHHLMPNLPTATLESDLKSGRELFENEGLRPDYLKIYPTMVTPFSKLAEMVGKDPSVHTAYTDEELVGLIAEIKKSVPEYCRIIRVIRDFPAESIVAGSKKSNLRQIMQRRGITCRCIRCREIADLNFRIQDSGFRIQRYSANGGAEYFISIDELKQDKLIGLCRLRLPKGGADVIFDELKNAAIVRELHVYGRKQGLDDGGVQSKTQHHGFGRHLMEKSEEIAKENNYSKIAVISAIGTREYYRKLGYKLEGEYMVKSL